MSHPTDANCIFCKIVAGQIPSFKLLEDDKTIAFMDINPVNPGHSLSCFKLSTVWEFARKSLSAVHS